MNSILIVSLRVAAIILALQFFKDFPSLYMSYKEGSVYAANGITFWLFHFLPSLFILGVSLIMWLFPHYLIKNFSFPGTVDEKLPIDPKVLHSAAITIISIYILASSTADLVYYSTLILDLEERLGGIYKMQPEIKAGIISAVSYGIIGLFLIVKSKPIAVRLEKIYKS